MAKVYKKTNYKNLQNRNIIKVDNDTKDKISIVIFNFVDYFKKKHLG